MELTARRVGRLEVAESWARKLTVLTRALDDAPVRIAHRVGRGIHLLLYRDAEEFLHVDIVPRARTADGFTRTRTTTVRFSPGEPYGPRERVWLRSIEAAILRVEGTTAWTEFLTWADDQPAPAIPSPRGTNKSTSGTEYLIRLLEPCQAKCAFCNCRASQPDMIASMDEVERRLDEAREAGFTWLVYTGGEPTLVRELPELIAMARGKGFERITLQTNGLKLADRAYTQTLADAGLVAILQSLHSHRAEVHDAIFQIPGAWEKGVRSVHNALDAGLIVGLNHVTTTQNMSGLADHVRWIAREFGTRPYVTVSFMAPQGWGEANTQFIPRIADFKPILDEAIDAAEEAGLSLFIPGLCGVPPCVLPDRPKYFSDLTAVELPQIDARAFGPRCGECSLRSRCTGFWKTYLDMYGADELVPVVGRPGDEADPASPADTAV